MNLNLNIEYGSHFKQFRIFFTEFTVTKECTEIEIEILHGLIGVNLSNLFYWHIRLTIFWQDIICKF
jgi:hypothetical protein